MAEKSFDLSEISAILNKEIETNVICLGLDVAQKRTGGCLIRTTTKKLYIEEFYKVDIKSVSKKNLHKKLLEYFKKTRDVRQLIEAENYPKIYKRRVIIEDCWFGMSVWVTKILARFETAALFALRTWTKDIPDPIQADTARKKIGFKKDGGEFKYETYKNKDNETKRRKVWVRKPLPAKEQIKNYISEIFEIDIEDDNCVDGLVLALSGVVSDE